MQKYDLTVERSPSQRGASPSPGGESHDGVYDDEGGSLYSDVASSQAIQKHSFYKLRCLTPAGRCGDGWQASGHTGGTGYTGSLASGYTHSTVDVSPLEPPWRCGIMPLIIAFMSIYGN